MMKSASLALGLGKSFGKASCVAFVAAVPLLSMNADARPRLTVDASVLAGGSTNPFLQRGSGNGAAQITATISPRVTFEEPKGNIVIGGTVRRTQYTRGYGGTDSVSAGISSQWRPEARINVSGGVNYDNSIAGEAQSFARDPSSLLPIIDDLALSGLRVRRQYLRSNIETSFQPSARDTISVGAFATLANVGRSSQFTTNDYVTYGTSVGYQRGIDARTAVGISLGASRYDCRNGPFCRNSTIQPSLTFSRVLNSRWTLKAAVGAAFTRSLQTNSRATQTTAAGNLDLCRKDARSNFCLNASRSTAATSSFGARPSTSVGIQYTRQMSPRSSITGSLNYANSSEGFISTVPGVPASANFEYWTARLVGNRQITENASLTLSGGYDRSSDIFGGDRSNFEILAGVSFSLGRQ